MSEKDGFIGQMDNTDGNSQFNSTALHIDKALSNVRTAMVVKIIAVHGGGVGPAPTVDVQMMVKQSDNAGNASSHGVIYGVPATRNQGGRNAFINDPKVGDIGHMVISDRDISSVKNNKGAESNPSSFRRHDPADGVYQAGMLNEATPTQYVHFTDTGITITDKNGNVFVFSGSGVSITCKTLTVNGNIVATGNITAGSGTAASVELLGHLHTNVAPGPANTGPPLAGS